MRAAYAAGYSERVPAREIGIYALELTAPLPAEQRRAFLAARGSPTTTRFLHGDTLAVLLWRDHPEDTLCFDAIAAHLGRVIGGRP